MTDELALIDSNILIYDFDASDKLKHKKAKEILDACWTGKKRYAVSIQNLSEFFVNVTNKIEEPISIEDGTIAVKKMIMFNWLTKLEPTKQCVERALELCAQQKIHYWDALIAATMIENGIFSIITENTKDFSKIREIQAKNPFS